MIVFVGAYDSTMYGPSEIVCCPSSALAGTYASYSFGAGEKAVSVSMSTKYAGRVHQLELDREVVLGDHPGQGGLVRCSPRSRPAVLPTLANPSQNAWNPTMRSR